MSLSTLLATLSTSTLAFDVTSPKTRTRLSLMEHSIATRLSLSLTRYSSSIASAIWSQILSGWPRKTDSQVIVLSMKLVPFEKGAEAPCISAVR